MAGLSPEERRSWNTRLDAAHRLWQRNGMTGDSVGVRGSPFRFIDMYRGDQWGGGSWAGISEDDLITVNMVFANTNQLVARNSKRNPDPVVSARRKNAEGERSARIRQAILSYCIYELKMKRQMDYALRDALVGPWGMVRHGYTPPAEKYARASGRMLDLYAFAKPDLPWIKRIPFWDFRADPHAENFYPDGSARWCAFRDLIPLRNFRETDSLIARDDLRATVSRERAQIAGVGQQNAADDDWSDLVEVWWVWDKEERKRFALSPGSQLEVSPVEDWPLQYEDLPYDILMFNEQMDSNIPIPYPAVYESQQYELNKTRTLMSQLVKHLRRLLVVNRNAFSDAERDKIEGGSLGLFEILTADGELANAIANIQIGGFPSDLLGYEATIKTDIRELIGLSNMDRGQRINVETATEAGGVQQGAEIIAGRNEEAFEEFWSSTLRHFNQALDFTLQPGMVIPIVGKEDAEALKKLADPIVGAIELRDVSMIQGEFDVKIRARSTLPEDKDRDLAKLLGIKQGLGMDPNVNMAELDAMAFELAGFDSSRMVLAPDVRGQTMENLMQQGAGDMKPGKSNGGMDANLARMLEKQ